MKVLARPLLGVWVLLALTGCSALISRHLMDPNTGQPVGTSPWYSDFYVPSVCWTYARASHGGPYPVAYYACVHDGGKDWRPYPLGRVDTWVLWTAIAIPPTAFTNPASAPPMAWAVMKEGYETEAGCTLHQKAGEDPGTGREDDRAVQVPARGGETMREAMAIGLLALTLGGCTSYYAYGVKSS